GFAKNVVILTRNRGHKKNPPRYLYWVKRKYSAYPGVVRTLENRWRIYNEMMDTIDHLEKQGRIFVIRPTELLKVSRIERNQTRLQELFDHGYESAHRLHESLIKWVREGEEK
ncbi:MAG TPA: DUF6363 domain-containing protein, partial [Chondromyces sp.]|nr:DUF6363 domain-containing protein [Chondromyces sp.]